MRDVSMPSLAAAVCAAALLVGCAEEAAVPGAAGQAADPDEVQAELRAFTDKIVLAEVVAERRAGGQDAASLPSAAECDRALAAADRVKFEQQRRLVRLSAGRQDDAGPIDPELSDRLGRCGDVAALQ